MDIYYYHKGPNFEAMKKISRVTIGIYLIAILIISSEVINRITEWGRAFVSAISFG